MGFEERKTRLLMTIVDWHIKIAVPISSKMLVENFGLGVSSATLRNDMAELEKGGFIFQPHTSAGRIPTEKGYEFYVTSMLGTNRRTKATRERDFKNTALTDDLNAAMKALSKKLTELTGEMAFVAFDDNMSFFTGVSKLFHKPEFEETEQAHKLSIIIDQFDEKLCQVFSELSIAPQIFIGSKNPFGEMMSSIIVRCSFDGGKRGVVVGLVGPLRMDYSRNLYAIEDAMKYLNEL